MAWDVGWLVRFFFLEMGLEVNRCRSVGFMMGCCCLVDVDVDLILCFLISIVSLWLAACDIILRIFQMFVFSIANRSLCIGIESLFGRF